MESGFKKVDKEVKPRLLHVKGRRSVRVWQVSPSVIII